MYSNNFSWSEVLLETVPENQGKLEALTNMLSVLFRIITFLKVFLPRAFYLYKRKGFVVLTFFEKNNLIKNSLCIAVSFLLIFQLFIF